MRRIYLYILLIVTFTFPPLNGSFADEGAYSRVAGLNNANSHKITIEDIRNSCGINSVYIALRILNKNQDYVNLKQELTSEENFKVSITDLENLLRKYKIKTRTVKLRPSQLYDNPNCLFIMYTPPPEGMDIGHFRVVSIIDEGNVQIIDPPYSPKILKKTDWLTDDRIIFTAVGDNFNPTFEFDILKSLSILMIISGVLIIIYGKFSKQKIPSLK